jgi:hypothetical protein
MKAADTRSLSTSLSRKDRVALSLEHEGNKKLRSLGTVLYRLTGGRIAPRDRDVILLTTHGRTSGREHTVLLRSFRESENMVVVAANSGRSSNLKTTLAGESRDREPHPADARRAVV